MSLNRKPYHSPIAIEMMKIAKEKGLIEESKQTEDVVGKLRKAVAVIDKEVGIEKKAEKRSFTFNIIDLCNQLRSTGFVSYAQELEYKFLTFKQAETHLYNVNGETGEDVLNMAHPDGSNDLGLGHEAEVETLLDKQKKILDIVRKQPKGKLAAKTAINAVKLLVAQQTPEQITPEKKYNNAALANLKQASQYFQLIENIVFEKGNLYLRKSTFVQLSKTIKEKLNSYNPTIDDINDIEKYIKAVRGLIRPGATGGVSAEAWDLLENHFMFLISPTGPLEKARDNIKERNRIISERQSKELNKENTTPPANIQTNTNGAGAEFDEHEDSKLTPILVRTKRLSNRINSWRGLVSKYPSLTQWIDDSLKDVQGLEENIKNAQKHKDSEDELFPVFEQQLLGEEKSAQDFFDKFIKNPGAK